MITETKVWILYDGRYLNDENSAIVYEVCHSLQEAKENASSYGTDTVIVEMRRINNAIANKTIIEH